MTGSLRISVILPVYRNAESLEELYRRLIAAIELAGWQPELVFVDDASPDRSGLVLTQLAASDRRVRVITHECNSGQHRAVLAGLAAAQGDWCVAMDADLQDPPEALPALIERGREGYDAVFGGRRGCYESMGKLITSRMIKRVIAALTGLPPDAGILVAIHRALVERLLAMEAGAPSLVAIIGCAGARTCSVPVQRAQRSYGRSAYSSWGRSRSAMRALWWVVKWKAWYRFRRSIRSGEGSDGTQ